MKKLLLMFLILFSISAYSENKDSISIVQYENKLVVTSNTDITDIIIGDVCYPTTYKIRDIDVNEIEIFIDEYNLEGSMFYIQVFTTKTIFTKKFYKK
jgi:hypothetical protein